MISYRQADLKERFVAKQPKAYDCQLDLVFPTDMLGNNDSDREDEYVGILDLKIPSEIDLGTYIAISKKVNNALSPNTGSIELEGDEDRRKFYSGKHLNMIQFTSSSLLNFENKIRKIATGPVTDNIVEYNNDIDIERITIRFKVTV